MILFGKLVIFFDNLIFSDLKTSDLLQFIDDGGFPIFPADTKETAPANTNVTNTSSGGSNNTKTPSGKVIKIIRSLLIDNSETFNYPTFFRINNVV